MGKGWKRSATDSPRISLSVFLALVLPRVSGTVADVVNRFFEPDCFKKEMASCVVSSMVLILFIPSLLTLISIPLLIGDLTLCFDGDFDLVFVAFTFFPSSFSTSSELERLADLSESVLFLLGDLDLPLVSSSLFFAFFFAGEGERSALRLGGIGLQRFSQTFLVFLDKFFFFTRNCFLEKKTKIKGYKCC